MFTSSDDEILHKIEEQLQKNCPSPENELIRLSKIAATLPDDETSARIRALVIDIDDLTAQTRWNLGQALLLMELHPQILENPKPKDLVEKIINEKEMPSKSILLEREFVARADKIFYSDFCYRTFETVWLSGKRKIGVKSSLDLSE